MGNRHIGSSLDNFLMGAGTLAELQERAIAEV
jgi:hypothetical protein